MLIIRAHLPLTHMSLPAPIRTSYATIDEAKKSSVLPAGDSFLNELTADTQRLADAAQRVSTLRRELLGAISSRKDTELRFRKTCLAFTGHINGIARGDASVITALRRAALVPPGRRRAQRPGALGRSGARRGARKAEGATRARSAGSLSCDRAACGRPQ